MFVFSIPDLNRTLSSIGISSTSSPVALVVERGKGSHELQKNNIIYDSFDFTDSKLKKAGMVSTKEIARDRGKPPSKYDRNIMIFDWLHTLDETATASHEQDLEHAKENHLPIVENKE